MNNKIETVTTKEIEEFMDKCWNYAEKEENKKKFGITRHKIYRKDYRECYIYAENDVFKFTNPFGTKCSDDMCFIELDENDIITIIQMDSSYVCNEFEPHKINKRDRYVGTNMSKVMRDKFKGKKLIFV